MSGLISEIVGDSAEQEISQLLAQLSKVEKEIEVINGKAITLKVDFQGVGSLSELTNLYKQQEEILAQLRGNTIQYVNTIKLAEEAKNKYNGSTEKLVGLSNKLADTMVKEAQARKENAKAILDEQKYIAALNKEKENQEKKALKAAEALKKEENAYLQLRKQYNEQSTALKGMIIQYGEADKGVIKMKADVDKMYVSLLKAEEAVGQHQRKVGQYGNATMALSQLIREAPAFANSINTGLMGVSNNIPILIDQFKILKAEVGSTGKALKIMGASFFGITNLISIGLTAFMMYSQGVFDFGQKADKASEEGKKLQSTLAAINEEASNSSLKEIASTESLFATAENLNLAYSDRIAAVEKLIELYPTLLGHIEREDFLTGNVAEKQKLYEIISFKSAIEARKKGIEELKKQIIELKTDQNLNEDGLNKFGETFDPQDYTGSVYKTRSPKTQAEIDRLTGLIKAYDDAKNSFEQTLAQLTQRTTSGRIWEDINNDIEEQSRIVKNTVAGTKEHIQALADLKKFQEEMDRYMGKDKAGQKDKGLSDALEDEKARHKLQLELNEQAYQNSRKTYFEQQQLNKANEDEARTHAENMVLIVTDWHKKSGESEDKYQAKLKEINTELLKELNDAKKAGDKIREAIIAGHIKANEEAQKYIENLQKQRAELQKINDEIDALQAKAAGKKEYAESINPLLEGFGFNTSFKQSIRQKNLDIAAQQNRLGAANEAWANEGVKGSGADPIKLLDLQSKAAAEKKNLTQLELEREDMYNQKIIEGKKELAQRLLSISKEYFDTMDKLRNAQFDAQQKNLDNELQSVQLNTQQQMRAIDALNVHEVDRMRQKELLAAQTAAKENEIRQQSAQLNLKRAIADKQAAELRIIAETAAAIMKTIASYSFPGGYAIAAALSAVIAAQGAAQYSAVAATPLPQYEKGGTTHTTHFIAGEKGAELGITPSGKAVMFDKPGIYTSEIGTRIKTADQTKKILEYASLSIGMSASNLGLLQEKHTQQMTDKRIVEKLNDVEGAIIQAAMIGRNIKNTVIVKTGNDLQRPR